MLALLLIDIRCDDGVGRLYNGQKFVEGITTRAPDPCLRTLLRPLGLSVKLCRSQITLTATNRQITRSRFVWEQKGSPWLFACVPNMPSLSTPLLLRPSISGSSPLRPLGTVGRPRILARRAPLPAARARPPRAAASAATGGAAGEGFDAGSSPEEDSEEEDEDWDADYDLDGEALEPPFGPPVSGAVPRWQHALY